MLRGKEEEERRKKERDGRKEKRSREKTALLILKRGGGGRGDDKEKKEDQGKSGQEEECKEGGGGCSSEYRRPSDRKKIEGCLVKRGSAGWGGEGREGEEGKMARDEFPKLSLRLSSSLSFGPSLLSPSSVCLIFSPCCLSAWRFVCLSGWLSVCLSLSLSLSVIQRRRQTGREKKGDNHKTNETDRREGDSQANGKRRDRQKEK